MRITNLTKKTVLAERAVVADTFLSRMIGLLDRSGISSGEALVITRCQSIHMLFMRFAIDVVFVDHNNIVVGMVGGIKPFRLSPIFFRASFAVEGAVGMIERSKTVVGDRLELSS